MNSRIGALAYTALLREVEATPKPGLVDCANSGAHRDMDIALFRMSAAAIAPYFERFARRGAEEAAEPLAGRLDGVRPLGMEAERAMYAATGGVNTHKGAIFTLGILTYLCGRRFARKEPLEPEAIGRAARTLCAGVERELAGEGLQTKGARAYRAYGAAGIRGEAATGFPSVIRLALPSIRRRELDENTRLCDALMHLVAELDDTNLLTRGGRAGADYAKAAARAFLSKHDPRDADYLVALSQLDAAFIAKNLSPGGSADLVAAGWFLDSVGRTCYDFNE